MIIIEKENIVIAVLTVILIILVIVNVNKSITQSTFKQGSPLSGKVIVLDAGHGGRDPGASGDTGVTEEKINLEVTLKLQKYLEVSGAYVILTRADQNGLYDLNANNFKRSDMKKRKEIINSSRADLFISIHQNKFPESKYKGAQVFYRPNDETSKKISVLIQKELKNILDKENSRAEKETAENYLLKNSVMPGILIECGFLSNKRDEKNLISNEYKENIAWAVYKGIALYYEHENSKNKN